MKIIETELKITTNTRNQMINITSQVNTALSQSNITTGDIIVFCPHTTAAITINENADPDVVTDMLATFSELIPKNRPEFQHCEGNSDAHCKSSAFGCTQQILIKAGKLNLGTWQGIFFCEFDGPRTRKVILQIRGQ